MNNSQNSGLNGVSEYLRELAQKKPNTSVIQLNFKSITDLLPYLHLLDRFPNLKTLNLHGNRIKELPTDLSVLKNVEQLDLTNNLLDENVEMTIISLKTMPMLKTLKYQVKKQKEKRIVEEIKTLEYLNNTKIIREKAKVEYQFKNATEKTLNEFQESLCQKFRCLMEYQKKYLGEMMQADATERFQQQCNQISRQCLDKLSMSKEKATDSFEMIMLYTTKFDMYELLKVRAVNICMDIYSDIGKMLKNVLDQQDRLFKQVSEMTLSLARIELDQKQKEIEDRYNNEFQSQHSIVNKFAVMQKELKRMRKQKDEFIAQISQLQSQNKKFTDFLVKCSKTENNYTPKNIPLIQTFQSIGTAKSKEQTPRIESGRNILGTKTGGLEKLMNQGRQNTGNLSYTNYSTGSKGLTLKQLKDVIEQIYDSKLKFDQKNYQGKLARETMNQYLFTYLNQKYGLKSLTLQAANNIVSGIQDHSAKDNDVAVFGKILRNQVDEEFRFVQAELKTTIHDLLKMHIKSKMPYKSTHQINEALSKRTNGEISFQECEDLIRYLYNKLDAAEILRKMETVFLDRQKGDQSSIRRRQDSSATSNRGKIQFSIFLQQVLNFQLKNHEKLLRPLVTSFKKRDRDSDGVIGQEQFVAIIEDLCEDAQDLVPSLLDIIDPYETKVITFTQMVRLVANYPQENPILNRYAQKNAEQCSVEDV